MSDTGEVRIVNEKTGAQKGSKLARFDLIPAGPLKLLAEHYGIGSRKYADRNWEKGYDWSLSFAALQRHAWLFWNGEDNDDHLPTCAPNCLEHTGNPHMVAVAWHALALVEFMTTNRALDNRPGKAVVVDPRVAKLAESLKSL